MTASPRPPSTTRAVSGTIRPAIADAVDAYVWGYPLVVMHRTRALLCSRTPVGTLNHRDTLATARDRAVVAPNNDTLYSSAWFDLRSGDLTIDVPAMDHADRYWSVMLLDAYTNVAYVSRRTHGVVEATVRVTLDPTTEPVRGYADVVTMATPTVWVSVPGSLPRSTGSTPSRCRPWWGGSAPRRVTRPVRSSARQAGATRRTGSRRARASRWKSLIPRRSVRAGANSMTWPPRRSPRWRAFSGCWERIQVLDEQDRA